MQLEEASTVLTKLDLSLSILTSHQSPPHPISARVPPTLSNKTDQTWVPTPQGWFLGTWYFSWSSSVTYQSWRNMQWTLSLRETNSRNDTLNDLTSYQDPDSSTVYMIYGIDTPTVVQDTPQRDTYNFVPTPPLSADNNTWEVISWGYDEVGVPYSVLYETAAAAQTEGVFDIISRSDKGPSQETLRLINATVKAMGNQEVITLLGQVEPLTQDGSRIGELDPICNATCLTNGECP